MLPGKEKFAPNEYVSNIGTEIRELHIDFGP